MSGNERWINPMLYMHNVVVQKYSVVDVMAGFVPVAVVVVILWGVYVWTCFVPRVQCTSSFFFQYPPKTKLFFSLSNIKFYANLFILNNHFEYLIYNFLDTWFKITTSKSILKKTPHSILDYLYLWCSFYKDQNDLLCGQFFGNV